MSCTDIQAKLAEAEKAYHELMLGQSVRVFVDQNGERVEYTAANKLALQSYINQLRSQMTDGSSCVATASRGPLRFTF